MTLIKNIRPKHNTFDFPVDGQIDIEFIDLMNKDSLLREDAVYLETNGARVPVERKARGGKHLSLIPKDKLKPSTTYIVTFNGFENGLEDFSKAPLRASELFYFGTESVPLKEEAPEEDTLPDEDEDPTETSNPEEIPKEIPEEVPVEPDTPIDDNFNEGVISSSIYLEKAYPDNGKVLNTGSPIVLIFSEELEPSDVQESVKLTHLGLEEDVVVPVSNIRKNRSNRHVITPMEPLKEGEDYELTIEARLSSGNVMLEEDITLRYKANWSHMYASIEDVRLLLGDFGDALTDEDIARLIHNQSKSIHQLMQGMEIYVPEEWVNQFPYAAGQYVMYKVAYQSMVGQTVASASGIRKDVELGDFRTSSSQSTSSTIKDLLAVLEGEIDKWWRRLNGEIVEEVGDELRPNFIRTAGSALRGETDNPNPTFTTRVPFREIGG